MLSCHRSIHIQGRPHALHSLFHSKYPAHTDPPDFPHHYPSASASPRLPSHPDRSFHRRNDAAANPLIRRPLCNVLDVVVREEVEEAHFQFVGDEESAGA